ncbi:LamG-like jellyroll fold domain-containing protein [Paenibacillus alkalitolerans]|uniref:LamG-like jellyroll fold domain-containing protein n=1 Tax=Paenibacillus alkalitolerans TaxID=2799335 RepID=UPI0018F4511E|nr:LamG-like jellyroll fold domain-containing protein [Paenibacillus alkalitolerans]
MTNYLEGLDDEIEVSGLPEGTVVKVYRTPTDLDVLGTTVTESTYGIVRIPQIGSESGVLYVSATIPGKMESARTAKSYPGENGLIHLKAEKDATLRFNTTGPGDATWMTILSNGTEEGNKRFGIVTFNNVPDFEDENIESVTLKMYRSNTRSSLLRAHHIEWDDWKEPGGGGTLGAELKAEYFNGSTEDALAFFEGPNASAMITPESENTVYGVNGSWYLDVTEIIKANHGARATFLLSVPSAEVNPLTKEYTSGTSVPGQFGPQLIVKYKTDNITAALSETDIKVTNNEEGSADTVQVSGLAAEGTVVKVYRNSSDTDALGAATVTESTYATVSIPQIGVAPGNLYVTATAPFKLESERTAKSYIGEPINYTKGSYYTYLKELERIGEQAEALLVQVPMSLYSFEGNADNAFGGSHGTANGTPVYAEGKFGQAIDLNGTDSFVTLPSWHALSTADTVTVAAWVNWRGGNAWQRIFDFGNNTSQYLFLTPRSGGNTLRFAIKNGGGEQLVQTTQLPANEWVHVAVTLGGGMEKLYVNGELKATNTNATIKPSDFKPRVNYIGKSQWPDPLFNGLIDEFRVYNYVLSAEDIQAAMNNTAKPWIDDSLVKVLLAEAAALDETQYTEESWQALEAAVAEANALPADADQATIDDAASKLLNAIQSLEPASV